MKPKFWTIVPAAGSGQRVGNAIPKQYLTIAGAMVIEHTLQRLLACPLLGNIIVVLAAGDTHWSSCRYAKHPAIRTVVGGEQRWHSVYKALLAISGLAATNDWVLVHDAARPCLLQQDIEHLITTVQKHPVGGVLGYPAKDSLKEVQRDGRITGCLNRPVIWHAQTPQMFRYGILRNSINYNIALELEPTDEHAAIERCYYKRGGLRRSAIMVKGSSTNIKITEPIDLAVAEFYLMKEKQ